MNFSLLRRRYQPAPWVSPLLTLPVERLSVPFRGAPSPLAVVPWWVRLQVGLWRFWVRETWRAWPVLEVDGLQYDFRLDALRFVDGNLREVVIYRARPMRVMHRVADAKFTAWSTTLGALLVLALMALVVWLSWTLTFSRPVKVPAAGTVTPIVQPTPYRFTLP